MRLNGEGERPMTDILYLAIAILAVNTILIISVAVVVIREIRAFRRTQNQLIIEIIIGGMATQEDKINLLLHDRGYTNETINDWINAQRKST